MKRNSIYIIALIALYTGSCTPHKKETDEHAGMHMEGMIHINPDEAARMNLQTDSAAIKILFETADYVGTTVSDENNIFNISARVNGRIETLYARNLGEEVRKGEPLYAIYSEELLAQENELLLTLRQKETGTGIDKTLEVLVESGKKKLLLWGLSQKQVDELIANKKPSPTVVFYSDYSGYISRLMVNEGEYVGIGKPLYQLSSLETVWINVQVYQDEIHYLYNNKNIQVSFEGLPGKAYQGQVVQNLPVLNENQKIATVRIALNNPGNAIKPGMMATITINRHSKQTLVIPKKALITGQMKSVWIQTGPGMYEKKMVETGMENKTEVEILSGIKAGDKVVSSGSYLLNSASVLENGANSMAGMDM